MLVIPGARRGAGATAGAALAIAVVAATACGSSLSDDQLAAAMRVTASEAVTGLGRTSATAPADAVGAGVDTPAAIPGSPPMATARTGATSPGSPIPAPATVTTLPTGIDRATGARTTAGLEPTGPNPRPAAVGPGPGGSASAGAVNPVRSPIHLGSVGTQSGPIGAAIAPAPVALRAWVADVNDRGGLAGHRLPLSLADDGGDPGKALSATRRMVEEEGVVAFVGLFGVATLQTVIPYLEDRKIPVVGAVPHPRVELSPVVFAPSTGNSAINESVLTSLVLQSPVRKVAVIVCREIDSCPKALREMKAYAPKVGVTIVHESQVSIAQPDYTAEVLAARNSGAEAVAIILDAPSVVRFIRSAHRQDWRPQFASSPEVYRQSFADAGGQDVEGVTAAATVLPFSLSPRMTPYRNAIDRWAPGAPTGDWGAITWVGGKLWERIAQALGEPVTRDQIFEALYSLRDETLSGLAPPLNFPRERTEASNRCFIPLRVAGGTWTAPTGDDYVCNER